MPRTTPRPLYDLFTNKKYLGVDAEHVGCCWATGQGPGSQAATRDNILKALHWIADNAKTQRPRHLRLLRRGRAAGRHRRPHRCYFASDSTFKGRDKNAVAAAEVGEALKKLKSQRFCVLLDVDFKGFTTNDKKVAEPTLGQ